MAGIHGDVENLTSIQGSALPDSPLLSLLLQLRLHPILFAQIAL